LPCLTLKTKAADSTLTLVLSWKIVKLFCEFRRMAYLAKLAITQTTYRRMLE